MKSKASITCFFIIIFLLTSCGTLSLTPTPIQSTTVSYNTPNYRSNVIQTRIPTPSLTISATNIKKTNTPESTQSIKPSISPTLSKKAELEILDYLEGPISCNKPCFLGVVPGKTTIEEAKDIFNHLGLLVDCKLFQGQEFCWVDYRFIDGLRVSANFLVENQMIKNITEYIIPKSSNPNTAREWLAFSPQTLINNFGPISSASLILGSGPQSLFQLIIIFDESDLIVEYDAYNLIHSKTQSICPLTDPYDSVTIWMGEDPTQPPKEGIPIDKATSLTINEFSDLLTGNPDKACFQLNGNLFP